MYFIILNRGGRGFFLAEVEIMDISAGQSVFLTSEFATNFPVVTSTDGITSLAYTPIPSGIRDAFLNGRRPRSTCFRERDHRWRKNWLWNGQLGNDMTFEMEIPNNILSDYCGVATKVPTPRPIGIVSPPISVSIGEAKDVDPAELVAVPKDVDIAELVAIPRFNAGKSANTIDNYNEVVSEYEDALVYKNNVIIGLIVMNIITIIGGCVLYKTVWSGERRVKGYEPTAQDSEEEDILIST